MGTEKYKVQHNTGSLENSDWCQVYQIILSFRMWSARRPENYNICIMCLGQINCEASLSNTKYSKIQYIFRPFRGKKTRGNH